MIGTEQRRQILPPLASLALAFAAAGRRSASFMSPIILGSTLGAAALTVGRGASQAVGNGLSFAAELLRGNSPKPADAQSAVQAQLKQQTDALSSRIQQELAAAGIQLTQPAELTSDGAGG